MVAFCSVQQHNAYMPAITVRDVPEATRNELASRAARSGRSLQEYLRSELISLADRPSAEALVERIRDRKARTGVRLTREQIVADVHADRR